MNKEQNDAHYFLPTLTPTSRILVFLIRDVLKNKKPALRVIMNLLNAGQRFL